MNFEQDKKHIQLCQALLEIPHRVTYMYNDFVYNKNGTGNTGVSEGGEGAVLGTSVNPIQTSVEIMPTTLLPPPPIFGPSTVSVMYNKNGTGAISATHVFGPSTYVLFHFFLLIFLFVPVVSNVYLSYFLRHNLIQKIFLAYLASYRHFRNY